MSVALLRMSPTLRRMTSSAVGGGDGVGRVGGLYEQSLNVLVVLERIS